MALLGQIALYGTVGIPVAQEAAAYTASLLGMTPAEYEKQHPNAHAAISGGLTKMVAEWFGLKNNFSESGSLLAGYDDNVVHDIIMGAIDFAVDGHSDLDLFTIGAGASGNVIKRTSDAISSVVDAATALALDTSLATAGDAAWEVVDGFASLTSTWSNAKKAYHLHKVDGIRSSRGNLLISNDDMGDMNLQTAMARAMGFQTDVETAYWNQKLYNKNSKDDSRQTMDALKRNYLNFMRDGNYEKWKAMEAMILAPYSELERRDFRRLLLRGEVGDSDFKRQAQQFARDYIRSGGRGVLPEHTSETLGAN